jgi:hypothetical protein
MMSEPRRRADRGPRPDLWRYQQEAGDGRAWTRGPGHPDTAVPEGEVSLAAFGYLGAFLGPVIPLGVYLIGRRLSPSTRHHAVMALNLSLTWLLYTTCCLILGGVLLLDSLTVALIVAIPIAVVLWLSTARYLIRGIGTVNRAEHPAVPAWICARIAR